MAALDAFREGRVQLIVCSDVAARGLDIPDVSHVINYDAPHHSEDYVHRIGRTGRAGKTGEALTIVTRADARAIAEIEKLIDRKIAWQQGQEFPAEEADSHEEGRQDRRGRRDERGGRRDERGGHRGGRGEQRGARRPEGEEPRADRHDSLQSDSRRHRAERPPREREAAAEERTRERAPPAPVSPGQPLPPRRDRPRRDDPEPAVVGLGDHVPSFLLRPVPKRRHPTHETEPVAEE